MLSDQDRDVLPHTLGLAVPLCPPTNALTPPAIFWTNYILKEAGSGGLETKAADAYYYYGAGDAGRERWQASKKAERETWLKAPYQDPVQRAGRTNSRPTQHPPRVP